MFYVYILWSDSAKLFYFGYTIDIKRRLGEHNNKESKATAPYTPWKLVFYSAFDNEVRAREFEKYLKSGSGKAFAYKRLVDGALKKDGDASGSPKS